MQSYDNRARPIHRYTVAATSVQPPPYRPRYASLVSPPHPYDAGVTSLPSLPPSLTPGVQPPWPTRGTFSPQLFTSPVSSAASSNSPLSGRMSLYGDHFLFQPPPPLPPPPIPRKPPALANPPPPLPPKPSSLASSSLLRNPLYPQSIPGGASPGPSHVSPTNPRKLSTAEEKDLATAFALAAAGAKRREEELQAQEEEDLAKALEESRLYSDTLEDYPSLAQIARAGLSASSKIALPPSPLEGESWLQMVTPSTSQHSEDSTINEPSPLIDGREPPSSTSCDSAAASRTFPSLYTNAVSNLVTGPTSSSSSTANPPTLSSKSLMHQPSNVSLSTEHTAEFFSVSPVRSSGGHSLTLQLPSTKPSYAASASSSSTPAVKPAKSEGLSSGDRRSPVVPSSPNLSVASSKSSNGLDEEGSSDTHAALPFAAIQYVEPELLLGVSLGFNRPVISIMVTPMKGQMPNVITLPYAKGPVFFFQAPSWRRMLKLMARLSATRIEPTVEALSVAKHELKLRTVIQFVKVHHSASEWRTVLYFTTDMLIPSSVANSHKYTVGDVGVLPFSYTLSALPTLLRDGAESPMAKYYVVPSTPTTPYPQLPINFPNLAMYLQSAVDDSRRAAHDSSSGLRKLASYIDSCYPNDAGAAVMEGDTTRRRVGGMLKRVIGKSKGARGRGNEEIYDLVTPFVANEWG